MDPSEQKRISDRIARKVADEIMPKLGRAYLRGQPMFLRYTPDGMEVDVVSVDDFYVMPEVSPAWPPPSPNRSSP